MIRMVLRGGRALSRKTQEKPGGNEHMQYIRLQIGCLLVVLYIIITYIKATGKGKMSCNRLFDLLMITTPWTIVFDGLTAWTVNHRTLVPDVLNRSLHLLFFLLMDATILITTMYMYDQLVGLSANKRKRNLLFGIPGAISLLLIVAGIRQLRFIDGKTTSYSMGFSVYVCFVSLALFYGAILYLMISRRKFLPRGKVFGNLSFIVIVGAILLVQIIFPEVLLTSVCSTMLLLGMYIDFEDPSLRKLTRVNEEMADGFATMVESRDNNTGGHIKRTGAYVNLILRKMRNDRRYRSVVNRDYLLNVRNAAPLHDIGKIATPDCILQKPGKLTDEEFAVIREHAAKGGEIIRTALCDIGDAEFRQIAFEVARYHHEKYNGKGYPDGLAGEQIPLHARIMAIADVFDAVSQKRCYRDALPIEECFSIIERGSGTDFDPTLTEIFLGAKDEVLALMRQNSEDAPSPR